MSGGDHNQGEAHECEGCPDGRPANLVVEGHCAAANISHVAGMCSPCWDGMGEADTRLACPCGAMHLRDEVLRVRGEVSR